MKTRTDLEMAVFLDGRSKAQLAKELGISQGHFGQIVSGKYRPRLTLAFRIADLLNVDAVKVFNERGEK